MKLIFVEDDEVDRLCLKRLFRHRTEFTTAFFEQGIEVLNFLDSEEVHDDVVIISDINMPNMNGLELLRRVRESGTCSAIPFFLFTACENDKNIAEAEKYNCDGYFQKPLDFKEFETKLKNLKKDLIKKTI